MNGAAALGVRVHSGWAMAIAATADRQVIERCYIQMVDDSIPGARQPYHLVEKWALSEAKKFIDECERNTRKMTRKAIGDLLKRTGAATCCILGGSGRPLGTLECILSSHALIHTAEGEFFRKAIADAAGHHGLTVIRVKEKELLSIAASELALTEKQIQDKLASIGKALGPPWRVDEKLATVAAWIAANR